MKVELDLSISQLREHLQCLPCNHTSQMSPWARLTRQQSESWLVSKEEAAALFLGCFCPDPCSGVCMCMPLPCHKISGIRVANVLQWQNRPLQKGCFLQEKQELNKKSLRISHSWVTSLRKAGNLRLLEMCGKVLLGSVMAAVESHMSSWTATH